MEKRHALAHAHTHTRTHILFHCSLPTLVAPVCVANSTNPPMHSLPLTPTHPPTTTTPATTTPAAHPTEQTPTKTQHSYPHTKTRCPSLPPHPHVPHNNHSSLWHSSSSSHTHHAPTPLNTHSTTPTTQTATQTTQTQMSAQANAHTACAKPQGVCLQL